LITLFAAGWWLPRRATSTVLFFGAMIVVMLLVSPVCHRHYLCLVLPLVMGLVAVAQQRSRPPHHIGLRFSALLWINVIATALVNMPGLEMVRDMGVAMYATLILWGVACLSLWKQRRPGVEGVARLPKIAA
jgi:hypothetical protein